MKKTIFMTTVLTLAVNSAQAQTIWTDFASTLYKSDIEKMEKTTGIVPDPCASVEDRFKALSEFAISKLDYTPSLASTIPVQMISLEEKILGKYTPPDEARIKAATTASQPQSATSTSKRQHKHGSVWNWISTGTLPQLAPLNNAGTTFPQPAQPIPYGVPPTFTMPTVTRYSINGGIGGTGTITTTPGMIMVNGTGLH